MNVGYGLALQGKSVLIIDLSLHTQVNSSFGLSSYFALTMGTTNALPFLDENIPAGSLEIIPGDEKLLNLERETEKRIDKNLLLKNFIDNLQTSHDYILINCPSSLCLRTINALAIAEEAIIPVRAGKQGLEELNLLLKTVSLVREQHNPELKIKGVLLIGKTEDVKKFLKRAKQEKFQPFIFNTQIRDDPALFKVLPESKILLSAHPGSKVSIDYLEFVRESFFTPDGDRELFPKHPAQPPG
jgi:chromosome partitioning protein